MTKSPVVIGASLFLALLVIAFLFVVPQGARVQAARSDLASAYEELSALESDVRALEALANDDMLQTELARARTQLPATADLEGIIAAVEGAAARSGVTLVSLSPSAPTESGIGSLSSIGMSINAEGAYFALAEFLFELENLDRLMRVTSAGISGGAGALSLQIGATVYTTDSSAGPGSDPGEGPEVGV